MGSPAGIGAPSFSQPMLLAQFLAEPTPDMAFTISGHGHFPPLPRDGCSVAVGVVPSALFRLQQDCPFGGARSFVSAMTGSILLPLSSSAPPAKLCWGGGSQPRWQTPYLLFQHFHNFTAPSTPGGFCCLWARSMKPEHPGGCIC